MWGDQTTGTIYTNTNKNYSIDRMLEIEGLTDYKFNTKDKINGTVKGVATEAKEDLAEVKSFFSNSLDSIVKGSKVLTLLLMGLLIFNFYPVLKKAFK